MNLIIEPGTAIEHVPDTELVTLVVSHEIPLPRRRRAPHLYPLAHDAQPVPYREHVAFAGAWGAEPPLVELPRLGWNRVEVRLIQLAVVVLLAGSAMIAWLIS